MLHQPCSIAFCSLSKKVKNPSKMCYVTHQYNVVPNINVYTSITSHAMNIQKKWKKSWEISISLNFWKLLDLNCIYLDFRMVVEGVSSKVINRGEENFEETQVCQTQYTSNQMSASVFFQDLK